MRVALYFALASCVALSEATQIKGTWICSFKALNIHSFQCFSLLHTQTEYLVLSVGIYRFERGLLEYYMYYIRAKTDNGLLEKPSS